MLVTFFFFAVVTGVGGGSTFALGRHVMRLSLDANGATLPDGASFVGYALREAETDEGWLVVLAEENRTVMHLRLEDIAEREPCRLPEEAVVLETFPSLLQLMVRESSALPEPVCPCCRPSAGERAPPRRALGARPSGRQRPWRDDLGGP